MNRSLRDMILGALYDAGGQVYLAEQARENPTAFLTLLGRVLPREPQVETPPAVITLDFGWTPRTPASLPATAYDAPAPQISSPTPVLRSCGGSNAGVGDDLKPMKTRGLPSLRA